MPSIQRIVQTGLVDPIASYLATGSPTDADFLTLLQSLGSGVVTPTIVGNVVEYTLNFQASNTVATALTSLGAQADSLGIKLDPDTKVNVTTALDFNFTFGVDTTAGLAPAQAFILSAPPMA